MSRKEETKHYPDSWNEETKTGIAKRRYSRREDHWTNQPKKVCCRECRFFRRIFSEIHCAEECRAHPIYCEDYEMSWVEYGNPAGLNKDNCCPDYQPKLLVRLREWLGGLWG